jgi:pimeloyl-ACP methyl ester carboxylesterase
LTTRRRPETLSRDAIREDGMDGGTAVASAMARDGFWRGDYWAAKEEVQLALYRKRIGAPAKGEAPRPVLFLVHGSSNSALSSFDLSIPGHGEYSLMNVFAAQGYDVWTMDHENYGRSSQTAGNSDIRSGVEDLKAAVALVVQETGCDRLNFLGVSSGAIRAGAFAQAAPEAIKKLVLVAFTYKAMDSPALKKRAQQLDYFRTHNRRKRDREMIRSIFARDGHPEFYDPVVAEALADAELIYGEEIPTGTYLDMVANLPLVDPAKVTAPVLLLSGEHDGNGTLDDLYDFFRALPNGDKQFVVLPRVAHSVTYSKNRHLFWHAVTQFLGAPEPC